MSIRNAELEDTQQITDVANNCAPNLRPSAFGTYEYFTRCFRSTFLVYEENEEIKGFVVGFPNIDVKGEYWLYQICVYSELRSKKIGSKLIVPFIEKIKEMGYKNIKSHANNQHSVNLHEKYGFKKYDTDESGWFLELTF
ncbi:MAG: GNAT family N-acetyltransferase [Promethearchaeota archaeon]